MAFSSNDRKILRDLARRVADIAALPIQEERRKMWKVHNALGKVRPMILVFPEGSWRELLPDSSVLCRESDARAIEKELRMRIFYHDHFCDDTVIEKTWSVFRTQGHTGWGPPVQHVPSTEATGSWGFSPLIQSPADLKILRKPQVIYDPDRTRRDFETASDLFGDILDVRIRGVRGFHFCLMGIYVHYRGLEQIMLDMYENPAMLHDAMSFLEEAYVDLVGQYRELNLMDLNNDGSYHSSGGVGYTDELPASGFDAANVRPIDLWAAAQSQELAQVSPEMHYEFAMQYEKRLVAPFGLNGYGCCEDLSRKLDYVLDFPNMRRISVAPSANVEACAPRLGPKHIFSWKPQPSHLVGRFDEDLIRRYIRHTLDVTRASSCVVEIILKDTHTCENHPERFTRWTEIARELVEDY